jgi:hypothetical protein
VWSYVIEFIYWLKWYAYIKILNIFKTYGHAKSAPRAMVKETKEKVLNIKDSFLKFQDIESTTFKIKLTFLLS